MKRAGLALAVTMTLLAGCAGQQRAPSMDTGPTVAQINTQLGVAYLQREQYELALSKIQKALDADPRLPDAHAAMGLLRERLGDVDAARSHYRQALALAPDDPSIQHNYGVFLCRIKEYEDARRYFLKAAGNRLYQTPAMAYTNAAICARQEGDEGAAERFLSQALDSNPLHGPALYEKAALRLAQDRPREARDFLERYWRVAGRNPDSLGLAIEVAEAMGETSRADAYRQQLREEARGAPLKRDMGMGSHD